MFHLYPVKDHSVIRFGESWAIRFVQILFFVFGLPVILTGLLLLASEGFSKEALIVTGTGAILMGASGLISSYRKKLPRNILFDLEKELIHIASSDKTTVDIGFGEIDSFGVSYFREQNYLLFMRLRNGSYWDLISCATRKRADVILSLLKEKINLTSKNTSQKPEMTSPFKILYNQGGKINTCVAWNEKFKLGDFIWTALFFGGFICIISAIVEFTWLFMNSRVFFAFLYGFLELSIIIQIVRSRLLLYILLIDPDKVRYGRAGSLNTALNAAWKPLKEKPVREVLNVVYSLDAVYGTQSLAIQDKRSAELTEELRSGDIQLGRIPAILKEFHQRLAILFPDKSITEILGLEIWLSGIIQNYQSNGQAGPI